MCKITSIVFICVLVAIVTLNLSWCYLLKNKWVQPDYQILATRRITLQSHAMLKLISQIFCWNKILQIYKLRNLSFRYFYYC